MKSSSLLLSVAVLSLLGGSGCAADANEADDRAASEAALTTNLPNPRAPYFANVTANGSGCPQGTWAATISDDGSELAISFDAYDAVIEPGMAFSIRDCTMSIDLRSPSGLSFAVRSFSYDAAVSLYNSGMTATLTSKYYFQGTPVIGERREELRGPYDDTFAFADQIAADELVWSPCNTSRQLNAMTRAFVKNNSAKTGSGHVGIAANEMRLRVNLAWRTC